jgi:hypothetical protein
VRLELGGLWDAGDAGKAVSAFATEVAILQAEVDVLGNRGANAGDQLPGKAGRAVSHADRRIRRQNRGLHAGHAHAAASKALKAVIRTEVDQAVHHEREGFGAAAQLVGVAGEVGRRRGGEGLFFGAAIARFRFKAEGAEVVAHDATDIVADLGAEPAELGVRAAVRDLLLLNDDPASVSFDVPGFVPGQGRRSEGRSGQRHAQGVLAHYVFPFCELEATN